MEGSIRENICYGCQREVSQEELLKVAKLAHVYDFVQDLPQALTPNSPAADRIFPAVSANA